MAQDYHALLPMIFTADRLVFKDLIVDLKTEKNINTLHCPKIILKTRAKDNSRGLRVDGNAWRFETLISIVEDKITLMGYGQLHDSIEIQNVFSEFKMDGSCPDWLHWLKNALQKGELTEGDIEVKGPLDALQFHGKLAFQDMDIHFDKEWPMVDSATGILSFNNQKIEIGLESGQIFHTPIESLIAKIAPFGDAKKPTQLKIQGSLSSNFTTGLAFVKESPLQKNVGSTLSVLKPRGHFHLDLGLQIPLMEKEKPVEVKGKITTADGQIDLADLKLHIKNLQGAFNFTEKGLEAKDLIADVKWKENDEKRNFSIAMNAVNPEENRIQLAVKDLFNVSIVVPQNAALVNSNSNLKKLHLVVEDLNAAGFQIQQTAFDLNLKSGNVSSLQLEGPMIKGEVILPSNNDAAYYLNLDYLKLVGMGEGESTQPLVQYLIRAKKPAIHLKVATLETDKVRFGSVNLDMIPNQQGYAIQNLSMLAPDYKLTGNGNWTIDEKGLNNRTSLKGIFTSYNIGDTLVRFDYPSPIRESSGDIQYDLSWPDVPYQFSLSKSSGEATLKFSKGRIIGADPGMSRMFGLLNIESIAKRVKLDFSDLTSKGFAFDSIKGSFEFLNGRGITQGLIINGSSARVELRGEMNFANKQVDIMMSILPKIAQVGAPIIGLLGGPIGVGVGLGTAFVLDNMGGSNIGIGQMNYHVTGTLASPHLEKIQGTKKNPPIRRKGLR